MKSLGKFLIKQFCFQKMLFQKYFGLSFLAGIPKKPRVELWCVAANPHVCGAPCESSQEPLCPAAGGASTLGGCGRARNPRNCNSGPLRGSRSWAVADPKGSGPCVGVDQSQALRGSQLCLSRAGFCIHCTAGTQNSRGCFFIREIKSFEG